MPVTSAAEINSLFQQQAFQSENRALVAASQPDAKSAPSLFIGQDGDSFFAPYPVRATPARLTSAPMRLPHGVVGLRNIIGHAESRRHGYDAVQYGARIKPRKPPTDMTLGEIYDWVAATPGQPHAIGRYQFIPTTLRRVAAEVGASRDTLFSPRMQDRLADVLLAEAGLQKFHRGLIGRTQFMNNLAKIWAGLPTSNGRSYYDGYAGNKASMTWAEFDGHMRRVFDG